MSKNMKNVWQVSLVLKSEAEVIKILLPTVDHSRGMEASTGKPGPYYAEFMQGNEKVVMKLVKQ